ncbi:MULTISPECIES: T9SS type A sorting domain-containing protein [Chryseobacterium]|uniref:T9SS C-terminal target domain-containing protein n=1 Tax=Chryseobacterium bernardetii TaxID=1241978 RepID=A0A3G6TCJ9_9FLAO|nr:MULTISPECIES: T9SS type A sorting domain-containing protein [Chryseobacterium]AZB23780.1 T9SS C-terminal target domain-containing protein [Chryseobacterium bernardetii]AZB34372.1 T9SS C-terminal target domain-containing protein [Chryseobacterium bernardetii]UCA58029.1 T9SS type A sorting domain-containing protein [Chryseobacterium rhizoplanae]
MKFLYLLCLVFAGSASAQTITFNGCHNLFDDQNFIFNKTGVDAFNKNIYITTPIDGQPCGGLGTCEFKIQWNNALTRWEFLADEGYGTFASPKLIYYNSTGGNAFSFPPGNANGTWVENTVVTTSLCGGNLTPTNSVMTGDVQGPALGIQEVSKSTIQIFPNPVSDFIQISGISDGQIIQIYNIDGRLIKSETFAPKVNVSQLTPGVYILKINTREFKSLEFKFVKK